MGVHSRRHNLIRLRSSQAFLWALAFFFFSALTENAHATKVVESTTIDPTNINGSSTNKICLDSDSAAVAISMGIFSDLIPCGPGGGGCTDVSGAAINPPSATIAFGNSQNFIASASGTSPFSYVWTITPSGGSPTVICGNSPTCAVSSTHYSGIGSYSVSVSISNCSSGNASASASLQVNSGVIAPTSGTSTLTANNFCAGDLSQIVVAWSGSSSNVTLHQVVGASDTVVGSHSNVSSPDSFSITPVSGATYYAVITNASGSFTTPVSASAIVDSPISSVTISPAGPSNKNPGESITYTSSVSGTARSYQWMKTPGGDISGATSSTYTIGSLNNSHSGAYALRASNFCGSKTSNASTLNIFPSNITVSGGATICPSASIALSSTHTAGTSPESYQWILNGSTSVPGATSSSYSATTAGIYTLKISNPAGDAFSSNSTTVSVYSAPPISSQPTNASVSRGQTANFSVTTSGSSLSIKWQKDGVDLVDGITASGSSISGSSTASLSISNAQPSDMGNYRVIVANTNCVGLSTVSNTASLSVSGVDCSLLSRVAPELGHPSSLETNVSLEAQFSWNRMTPYADSCGENYIVRYRLANAGEVSAPSCSSISNQSSEYISSTGPIDRTSINQTELHPGLQLQPLKTYFWCVQIAGSSVTSSVAKFTTRSSDNRIATPTLKAEPATVESTPSGTQNVRLVGGNGEYQARAIFWQIVDGTYKLIDVIDHIENPNNFYITADVNRYLTGTGERRYVVQISRESGPLPVDINLAEGPISIPASYWFDQSLVLTRPILERNTDLGASDTHHRYIKIQHPVDSSATHYDIYRRIENEGCIQSATVSCFLGTKPAKLIGTLSNAVASPWTLHPATADYSYLYFSDDETISGIDSGSYKGISYFAVARDDLGNSSLRSLSVSFFDRSAPETLGTAAQPLPLATGRDFKLIITGIDLGGFFRGENQPDMHARVWVNELQDGDTCSDSFASAGNLQENDFDSLKAASYSDGVTLNGIEAITVTNLKPDKPFCYRACISGMDDYSAMPPRESCYAASTGVTQPDHIAPDFTGLTSAVALNSGTEVLLSWNAATRGRDEVVRYQVFYTKLVDDKGHPDFTNSPIWSEENPLATRTVIANLEPGVKYYFKGSVLDGDRNRNTPEIVLSTTTMWVGPSIQSLGVSASPAGYSYQKVLDLSLVHPHADLTDTRVSLDHLWYSINGGKDFVEVDRRYIVGADLTNFKVGNSTNTAGQNQFVVDTLAYFQGQRDVIFAITVKDQNGLISPRIQSGGLTVNLGNSAGGTGRAGLAGSCGLIQSPNTSFQNSGWGLIFSLFAGCLLGLVALRQRLITQRATTGSRTRA